MNKIKKTFFCDLDPMEGIEVILMAMLFFCGVAISLGSPWFLSGGIGAVVSVFSFDFVYSRWKKYKGGIRWK